MELYEAIKTRRSVRHYLPTPVPQDKLDRLWTAVQAAPSACNIQPWRFLLIKTPEVRERLRKVLQDWVVTAPLVVVALGNPKTAWRHDGESIHAVDVAIAFEHLVLAATAEGLGTCWICAFDRRALSKVLQLSSDWDPVAVTPLGFPDDPSPRSTRKSVSEILQIM